MYSYAAQIPEELGFQKGDILAVLRLQDDGWWEAEPVGNTGRPGLVPSNYLQPCWTMGLCEWAGWGMTERRKRTNGWKLLTVPTNAFLTIQRCVCTYPPSCCWALEV